MRNHSELYLGIFWTEGPERASLCAIGNWRKSQDNLNPKYYEAFADYLTEVVLQYKKWGLQFDTLAPFNEPCEGWWYIDRNKAAQEGCNFSARSMDKVGAQWKAFLPISSNF